MSEEQAAYNVKPSCTRLIDGDKLLEWSRNEIEETERVAEKSDFNDGYITALKGIIQRIQYNHFLPPSDQGEAARLREVLVELYLQIGRDMDINPSAKSVYLSKLGYVVETLTTPNTEDARAQKVREMYSGNEGLYIIGIRDTLNALGITIPGITDGGDYK
jgi:hypothetical protein